jgi:hypothetical protein
MATPLPGNLVRLIRDRQALLWVCQRYDLPPGEQPHDYDLSEAEASLRYRASVDETDRGLASVYWEGVWLEGARSPVLAAIRDETAKQPAAGRRSIVVLASEADAQARVASHEFLPVCSLPGLLDPK